MRAAAVVAIMMSLGEGNAALAQAPRPAAPICPRDAAPIPAELRGWSSRTKLASATGGAGPEIALGKAYDVSLHADAKLELPNLPGPVKDRVGRGGTMHFTVAEPGTYHVALGSGVWVDVVRNGKALESVAHGHGPSCSGIAKIVDFALTPGAYTLTLDGSETGSLAVLVARAVSLTPDE